MDSSIRRFGMATKGSEFGGVPGRIQPLPHSLTPAEEARLMRATMDTEDPAVETVETRRVAEAGKRGVGPVDLNGDL
jgi:hypothetical protein